MRRWMRVAGTVAGGVAAGTAFAAAAGAVIWKRSTTRAVRRLGAGRAAGEGAAETFSRERLAGLPAPVTRYFELALTPGQPLFGLARITHEGEFAMRPGQWTPFHSGEHFQARPRGFVWDATIRAASLVSVRVRDSYLAGEGATRGAVGALFPVVNQHGTPELASGALHRWLGEAPWLPTALLPGDGLAWEAIDDTSARATVTDGATTVSADFRFDEKGAIVGMSAERYRDTKGTPVLTPWRSRLGDYQSFDGMTIPTSGEVEWVTPEGAQPYWRGRIVRVEYEWDVARRSVEAVVRYRSAGARIGAENADPRIATELPRLSS